MLSMQDKKEISDAIALQEQATSGEIVTVLARQSSSYHFTCLLWSSILTLLLPLVLTFAHILEPIHTQLSGIINITAAETALILQLLIFPSLFLLLDTSGLAVKLTPKTVRYYKAKNLAQRQFFLNGLHLTKDRAAILLFISEAERYVEIIADKGINDIVGENEWAETVTDFLDKVKQKQVKDAFISTINRCGALLSTHFPADGKENHNELSDQLIEI